VVTDRLVLHQQLQEDIYQFDHAKGVAKLTRIPGLSEIPYPTHMEPNLVIEFYSR